MVTKKEEKQMLAEGWVKARAIVELVGKPKGHIDKTLVQYIKSMANKNVVIVKEKVHKTKRHEGNLFAAFAELEILFKTLNDLVYFCFDYMPSSIEIDEPSELNYKARELTYFINDLQGRLHEVDMVVKQLRQQNINLNESFTKILKNFVSILCVSPKKIEEIGKIVGMDKKFLKIVIDVLIKEKRLKKGGDKYKTVK